VNFSCTCVHKNIRSNCGLPSSYDLLSCKLWSSYMCKSVHYLPYALVLLSSQILCINATMNVAKFQANICRLTFYVRDMCPLAPILRPLTKVQYYYSSTNAHFFKQNLLQSCSSKCENSQNHMSAYQLLFVKYYFILGYCNIPSHVSPLPFRVYPSLHKHL